MPQFGGGTGGPFEDWAFAFKRSLRAIDAKAYELLTKVETEGGYDLVEFEVHFSELDVKKYSAEIFDIICQAVSGEPLQIIRIVEDTEGLEAWWKLTSKYSPKSTARAVRLVGQVKNPPKVTNLSKAESELDKWEELVKTLRRDFKETFSDTVKWESSRR